MRSLATQKSKVSPSPVSSTAAGTGTRAVGRPAGKRAATKPAAKPNGASASSQAQVPAPEQLALTAIDAAPPATDTAPPIKAAATKPALTSVTGSPIQAISLLFDPEWYLATYPDVAAAGLDPIRHFFEDGAREGRDPNAFFNTGWYLAQNQDVVASKVNPFLHYLLYGAREGRQPAP